MAGATRNGDLQVVVFAITDQLFGMDIARVSEIIRMEKITPIPQAPYYTEGVINVRGSVIPVINLQALFNMQACERDNNSRVIIVESEKQKLGLIVDAVYEVKKISPSQIRPTPPAIGTDQYYLKGIILDNDRLVVLLDPDKLLPSGELEKLLSLDV